MLTTAKVLKLMRGGAAGSLGASKKANKESERTAGRGNEEKGRHAKVTRMKWALYSSSKG